MSYCGSDSVQCITHLTLFDDHRHSMKEFTLPILIDEELESRDVIQFDDTQPPCKHNYSVTQPKMVA